MGDSRGAEKTEHYDEMAQQLDMRFSAFVLYTYGGFHETGCRVQGLSHVTDEGERCPLPHPMEAGSEGTHRYRRAAWYGGHHDSGHPA